MKELVRFFIDNHKLTIVLTIFAVIFGVMGLMMINAEEKPSVAFAIATVTTSYDGASAEEIEIKITKPIEDELRTVSGIRDVTSISQSGRSNIVIRADIDNIVISEVMSDLQKAVDRVTNLPSDLREAPRFLELKAEEFPVFEIAVVGPNENRERDQLVDDLKEEIEDNFGVLRVDMTGHRQREFEIYLDLPKLNSFHIGVNEVLNKIKMRNINIPGGSVKSLTQQKLVRIEGKISGVSDLENILIRSNFTGQKIYLKDIAKVIDGMEEAKKLVKYEGKDATIMTISKKGGVDTLKLVAEVKETIERFEKKFNGRFKLAFIQNEGVKVEKKMGILAGNAFTGLILVIVFLFIFLPGRIGFLASLSLPLAVLITCGFMYYYGFTLNTITVLALVIALGMLVDNSVVISENFSRFRFEGMNPSEAAYESLAVLWLPITATAFTTIAAFLPMMVTKGIMGKFLFGIPVIVTTALLVSLLESFFLLPMRLVKLGGKVKTNDDNQRNDWFTKFEDKFSNMMRFFVRKRYWVALGFVAIFLSSFVFMFVLNRINLFPAENTEMYRCRIEMPKGTTLEHTGAAMSRLMDEIKTTMGKQLKHVVGVAGMAGDIFDAKGGTGDNMGYIRIYVTDETRYNVSHLDIVKRLRDINPDYVTKVNFDYDAHGPPVGKPLEATFRSTNEKNLYALLDKVQAKLNSVKGIYDVQIDDVIGDDEIFVDIDHDQADRLGLNVENIGNTIRSAVAGKRISNVTLKDKKVDINVRLAGDYRENIDSLKNVKVMDDRGNLIPLGQVSSLRVEKGSVQKKRYNYKRAKKLTASIDEKFINSISANMILKETFQKYRSEFPDVSLVFGGMAESTKESMESLFNALILSLIGIFALLVFLFRSYLRPFVIMTTIPLGLFGFSVAFALHGRQISFLALIGIIGLGGIIVNSGIILISFIDEMRKNKLFELEEVLARASGLRLRAVLVTSMTTISGLLPTAYGIGGSDATLVPMTMAMAWGLTSGTILTIIWVPCAYAIIEDISKLNEIVFSKLRSAFGRDRNSEFIDSIAE